MKCLVFLIIVNIILIAYVITECISIREEVKTAKAQQNTTQMMVSRIYFKAVWDNNVTGTKKRNHKLQDKKRK